MPPSSRLLKKTAAMCTAFVSGTWCEALGICGRAGVHDEIVLVDTQVEGKLGVVGLG